MKYKIKRVVVFSSDPDGMIMDSDWEPFAVVPCSSRPVGVSEAWTIWLRKPLET